jgi:Putative cyclase
LTRIVDLTLKIGEDTLSPPSVNKRLELTTHHRGPGFWQASEVNMLLHTGSHVDFARHCTEGGETAADVSLDRTCGQAIVIDLTFLGEDEPITVALLEQHAPELEDGAAPGLHIRGLRGAQGDPRSRRDPDPAANGALPAAGRGARAVLRRLRPDPRGGGISRAHVRPDRLGGVRW